MLKLSFRQTHAEMMVRAAATLVFSALYRRESTPTTVAELAVRPQYGFTASASANPIGPKLVRITDLQDGKINWSTVPFCECAQPEKYLLSEGDILFARTGATTGKTYLVSAPEPAIFASYLIRLRAKPGIDPAYLYAFFQSDSYWSQISEEKEGSAQPNVNGEKLAAVKIPIVPPDWQQAVAGFLRSVRERQDGGSAPLSSLPPPLADCQRAMYRIEEMSASIREAQRLKTQAAEEVLDIMAARERTIWSIESLENAPTLATITTFLARGRQSQQGQSDHFLIKTQHVQQDRYIPTMLRLDSAVAAKVSREATVRDGDVLIACSAAGCLGRVARYTDDGRAASTDTHVAIARADPEAIDPDYLYAYLRGAQGQYQLRSRERGDWKREKISFRLTELNLNDLKKVPVPVPARTEQSRIVAELNELESQVKALTRLQAQTAEEINALLPSILSKAFEGDL